MELCAMIRTRLIFCVLVCLLVMVTAAPLWAQDQTELAKKLQSPVANLISVPIQNNWDFGIGSANAMRYTANIQARDPVLAY